MGLSDRKIIEWAEASGMWKKPQQWKGATLDRPDFSFGLPQMEDQSVQRIIANVAPMVPRNYVVMAAMPNLVADMRKKALNRFAAPVFKKIAYVAMGEPDAAFRKAQLDGLLEEKQVKENAAWEKKRLEIERKKRHEEAIAKAAELKAKREAAAKAKKEADDAKKEAAAAEKKEGEKKEGEEKKEEKKEEEKKEEEKKDEPMPEAAKEEKKEETKEEKKEETKEEVKEEKKEEAAAKAKKEADD